MTTSSVLAAEETTNFLLPNATIFVEFLLFLIVLFVLRRYVVPPLSRAMDAREAMVRKQIEDRDKAARTLQQAQERYEAALAEARAEAASIRDQARADAARVRAELREQTDREVERIQQQGAEQLAAQQAEAMRQLRTELGGLSTGLAERVIGEPLSKKGRSAADRLLGELEHTPAGGVGS